MPLPDGSLSDEERRDWLRLARSERVGPVTFFALLERFGGAAEALEALPALARRGGSEGGVKICSADDAQRELECADRAGLRPLAQCEPGYPRLLAAIADPPPLLYLCGNSDLLARPAVALVGARNASAAGCRLAADLAAGLGAAGFAIVSGLARGIDAAAHRAALAHGTLAVLAGGADVPWPPENRALHEAIAETGLLLSEQPPGTQPQARHFPRRNRIIAGLSYGTVVVEAALRSGSLITARLAAEQGRLVFAVPGSPLDPRHHGTNRLLRQGATLTENAQDVLDEVRPMLLPHRDPAEAPQARRTRPAAAPAAAPAAPPTAPAGPLAGETPQRKLLALLGGTPTSVDELVRQSNLTPHAVLTILLELELAGRIDRHAGNRVALREVRQP